MASNRGNNGYIKHVLSEVFRENRRVHDITLGIVTLYTDYTVCSRKTRIRTSSPPRVYRGGVIGYFIFRFFRPHLQRSWLTDRTSVLFRDFHRRTMYTILKCPGRYIIMYYYYYYYYYYCIALLYGLH